jgi:MFS family permease
MNAQKLWTKNFILTSLSALFSALVFYIAMTTLAMYAVISFEASASIAGLVASIFVIGGVIGRIFSGSYIERIGRRKIILLSSILFFLASSAYLLSVGIVPLLTIRFLHGVTFGILHNALSTVVISFIPKARLGEGIAFFSLHFTIAIALGPFIGMFFIQNFSYKMLFAACAISALLCSLFTFFIKIEEPVFTNEQIAHFKGKISLRNIFEYGAVPIAFVMIFMSLCYSGITAFLNSSTAEMRLSYIASAFCLVYGVCMMVFRPLAGKLLDKKGDNIVMFSTIIFYAASLFMIAFARSSVPFLIAAVFLAIGYGNILNIGYTIAVKSVDPHRVSTATSTYFVFSEIGLGIGPMILGLVVTWKGFSTMYLVEAGIIILSIPLYYALHGKHAHKRANPVSNNSVET